MRKAVFLVLTCGVGLTLTLAVRPTDSTNLFSLAILLWTLVPFALVALVARSRSLGNLSQGILLAATTTLTALSLATYNRSVTTSSSTAGLVFVFLPLWELVGLIPVLGGAWALRGRLKSRVAGAHGGTG